MNTINQKKEHKTPEFKFVREDGSNAVFFTASGPEPTPTPTSASAKLSSIGSW